MSLEGRHAEVAVDHAVGKPLRVARRLSVGTRVVPLQAVAVGAQLAAAPVPLAIVGERPALAFDHVARLVVARARPSGLAVAPASFAPALVAEVDALGVVRGPAEVQPTAVGVAAFQLGESALIGVRGFLLAAALAVQGEAQLAWHQRPGEIGAELVALPAEAVLAHAAIEQTAARPGIGGAPGDHVHHPAEGFRTVERGHRSAYHLDTLDALHRHPAEVEVGMGDGPGRGGDPLAVHQHQGVLAGHAANADAPPGHADAVELQAFRTAQGFLQVAHRAPPQVLGGDQRNAGRGVAQLALGSGGADHGRLQVDRRGQRQAGKQVEERHGAGQPQRRKTVRGGMGGHGRQV